MSSSFEGLDSQHLISSEEAPSETGAQVAAAHRRRARQPIAVVTFVILLTVVLVLVPTVWPFKHISADGALNSTVLEMGKKAIYERLNAPANSQCEALKKITSWEECKGAAGYLGLQWKSGELYASCKGCHWTPPGCWYWPAQAKSGLPGTELGFNPGTGSNNGNQDSLCSTERRWKYVEGDKTYECSKFAANLCKGSYYDKCAKAIGTDGRSAKQACPFDCEDQAARKAANQAAYDGLPEEVKAIADMNVKKSDRRVSGTRSGGGISSSTLPLYIGVFWARPRRKRQACRKCQ